MISRTTWVILVVFAILLAATIFWTRSKEEAEAQITPTSGSEAVLDFAGAKVVGLRLDDGESKVVELMRGEDEIWKMTWPKGSETDVGKVEAAITQLLALRALNTIQENLDLAAVGLSPASFKILIRLDNGEQVIVNVGKETVTGSGYYVLVDDRVLYVVDKYGLDTVLNLVKEPPFLPTPTSLPTVEITPGATITP